MSIKGPVAFSVDSTDWFSLSIHSSFSSSLSTSIYLLICLSTYLSSSPRFTYILLRYTIMRFQISFAVFFAAAAGIVSSAVIPAVPNTSIISVVGTVPENPSNKAESGTIVDLARRSDPLPTHEEWSQADHRKFGGLQKQASELQSIYARQHDAQQDAHRQTANTAQHMLDDWAEKHPHGHPVPSIVEDTRQKLEEETKLASKAGKKAAEARRLGQHHQQLWQGHMAAAVGDTRGAAHYEDQAFNTLGQHLRNFPRPGN
ncbi:hypothetical protein FRB91_000065 [Serendipita sp. 411]|nr:hypothetical protein FRC18_011814 [Serendipita sp. 400]KAG8861821.1 hypothetical protein FRB91_000065 [Serendipita sp. 411]